MISNASFPTVNQAAFLTITALGVVTIGSAVAAATVATTVATVAYAALAVTSGAVSIASITAWVKIRAEAEEEQTASNYLAKVKDHSMAAIPAMYQFVAQTLVQALVQGLADGIAKGVSRKIAGEDHTVKVVHENS